MKHDPAHQLHVEMALAQGALGCLAHGGERVDEQVVEAGALVQAGAQVVGAGA